MPILRSQPLKPRTSPHLLAAGDFCFSAPVLGRKLKSSSDDDSDRSSDSDGSAVKRRYKSVLAFLMAPENKADYEEVAKVGHGGPARSARRRLPGVPHHASHAHCSRLYQ